MSTSTLTSTTLEFKTGAVDNVKLTAAADTATLSSSATPGTTVLLKGLTDPVDTTDATTKSYVDNLVGTGYTGGDNIDITGTVIKVVDAPVFSSGKVQINNFDLEVTGTGNIHANTAGGIIYGASVSAGNPLVAPGNPGAKYTNLLALDGVSWDDKTAASADDHQHIQMRMTAQNRLDLAATAGLLTGNVLVGGILSPVNDNDATTKKYVDDIAQGLNWHAPVSAATVAPVTIANPGTDTFDGQTLVATDRLLVKNQANSIDDGIYLFDTSSTPLTRALDMNTGDSLIGVAVFVLAGGAVNGEKGFVQTEIGTVGTDPQNWVQFTGVSIQAGNNISVVGNTVNVIDAPIFSENVTIAASKLLNIGNDGGIIVGTNGGVVLGDGSVINMTNGEIDMTGNGYLSTEAYGIFGPGGAVGRTTVDGEGMTLQNALAQTTITMTHQAQNRVDMEATQGILAGDVLLGGIKTPELDNDAVNKQYVDQLANGLSWMAPAQAATTTNIVLSPAPAVIDGVTIAPTDRVLVKDQTIGSENGVYELVVTDLVRVSEMPIGAPLTASAIFVEEGTVNADKGFVQTKEGNVGTDSQAWVIVHNHRTYGR